MMKESFVLQGRCPENNKKITSVILTNSLINSKTWRRYPHHQYYEKIVPYRLVRRTVNNYSQYWA